MQEFIASVTDRTQADVDRVKYLTNQYLLGEITEAEKEEWETDLKGALNRSDLLRVGNNIVIVLEELGYIELTRILPGSSLVPSNALIPGVVSWDSESSSPLTNPPELPNVSYFNAITSALTDVWEKGYIYINNDLSLPERPYNAFNKWNIIESILQMIHEGCFISDNDYQYADGTYYANSTLI